MDRVEKMRQKQMAKQGGKAAFEQLPPEKVEAPKSAAAEPSNGAAAPLPPPAKKAKQKVQGPMVRFRCSHEKPAAAFLGTDCGECRSKLQQKKKRLRLEKLAAEKHDVPPESWRKQMAEDKGRLPDGAAFDVVYNALMQEWSGSLTIARDDIPGGHKEFSGSGGGLEGLLRKLAKECWTWLEAQKCS